LEIAWREFRTSALWAVAELAVTFEKENKLAQLLNSAAIGVGKSCWLLVLTVADFRRS
jgi:hypothetical protein